jgi:hypothetical protein
MRKLFVLLLLSSLALAQTTGKPSPPAGVSAQSAGSQAPKTSPAPATVAPTTPVITVDGVCRDPKTTPPASCKTVVTRAEFEKLASALNPQMPEPMKRQLANAYAQLIAMSMIAEQRGLENRPDTAEVLRFARMQALGNLLLRNLQQEAANVPQAEVEKYYNEHKGQYTEATLERLFIPKTPAELGKPPEESKLKAEADKIHAAAAAGGDFEKLQKQAYDDLGLKSQAPPVAVDSVRRDALPPAQAKVFDMPAGQVSEVLDEPGGFYIYKMVSRKTLPVTDAEPEVKRALEQQRMQQEMEQIRSQIKPEFNDAYFGGGAPEGPPTMPPSPARRNPPPGAAKPGTTPPPAPPKQ